MDTYAEMQYRCAEDALASGVEFDFAHYWEDICFKNGPLIAPDLFEKVCARHYKKRNELCRKHGIDLISLDCDGVIARLVPAWFENGVNVMFPLEVGVWGDQFAAFRETYGPRLKGVGGFDKTCLRKDRAAVDAELERMKALVSLGGFLPCPDHRLMPGEPLRSGVLLRRADQKDEDLNLGPPARKTKGAFHRQIFLLQGRDRAALRSEGKVFFADRSFLRGGRRAARKTARREAFFGAFIHARRQT